MYRVNQVIQSARRRMVLNASLRLGTIGLGGGVGIGLALLIIDRALRLNLPVWTFLTLVLAGVFAGVAVALLRFPTQRRAVSRLDHALHLKDQLSTAHALDDDARTRANPFAPMVRKQAESLAESANVGNAIITRAPDYWWAPVGALALLIAGVLFVPHRPLPERSVANAARTTPSIESRQQAQETSQAISTVRDILEDDADALDPDTLAELKRLDDLAQQLAGGPVTPAEADAARDASAAALDRLADREQGRAQRDLEAAHELARRFQGLDRPEAPMSADQFAEALQRGEFGDAADILDSLDADREAMTDSEKEQAAERLREINEHLREATDDADATLDERTDQLRQTLEDLGLDEPAIDQMLDDPPDDPAELIDRLEDQGVEEPIASELAEQIRGNQERQAVDEQTDQDARDITEAIDRAADQLAPPSPPTDPDAQEPKQGPDPAQPDSSQQPADVPSEHPQDQGDTQAPQQQPSDGQPNAEQGQPDQQQSDGGDEQREVQQPGDDTTKGQTEQPREQPDETQEVADPSADQATQPIDAQDDSPEGGDAQEIAEQADKPGTDPGEGIEDTPRQPSEALRRLAERRRQAMRQRDAGERLRETARELAGRDTPPDDRWTTTDRLPLGDGDGQRDGQQPADGDPPASSPPADFQIDTLDLAGDDPDDPGDQLIAQWLSDRPLNDDTASVTPGASSPVSRARRIAERAVDDAGVHRRYHDLIRRYFGRLPDTVEQARARRDPSNTGADSPK